MFRATGWMAEQHAADQRRFTNLLIGSAFAHVLFVALMAIAPLPDAPSLPEVLTVDLVAAPPAPAPRAAPKAAPKPVPAPAPKAPPKPVPKEIVLPKQAPKAIPKKKRVVAPPPRPEPIEYEDALSQLRNELGEMAPEPVVQETEAVEETAAGPSPEEIQQGIRDKELAEWVVATTRRVKSRYIMPPEFRNRGLTTGVEVVLTSTGEIVGTPRVVVPSGDPFFDDNTVRALMMSAPLPAPPFGAGSLIFNFRPEGGR